MPHETALCSKRIKSKTKIFSFQRLAILLFGLSFLILFLSEGPLRNIILPSSSIEYFIPPSLLIDDSWYEILFNKNAIGYFHSFIRANKDGSYTLRNKAYLGIPMLGKVKKFDLDTKIDLNKNYSLEYAGIEFKSSKYFLKGTLNKEKDKRFKLSIASPSQNTTQYINTKGEMISSSFVPMIADYIPLRKRTKAVFFDPFLNKKNIVYILNKGRQTIAIDNKNIRALKFIINLEGVKGTVYTDSKGHVLKQEIFGFEFIRTDPVRLFRKNLTKGSRDLAESFTVSAINIPDKEKLKYLKIRIKGVNVNSIPDTFSQHVNRKESTIEIFKRMPDNTALVPIESAELKKYLGENTFIRFRSNEVSKTAREITGKEKDAFEIIKLMNHWIDKNIEKIPTISVPESLTTIKLRQGDCGELSALLTGFLRSVGIPSYVNIGLVYENSKFFYHAWVSAFMGKWIDVDPALGQNIADATHITLAKGLKNQLEILKFIGNIKIDIISYGY